MDTTKAKKVVELTKEGRKMLVTLWEGDKISTCVTEEQMQTCQTCQGDDQLCNQFVEYLKEKGYQAAEVELGELEVEESLPRFLERGVSEAEPEVTAEVAAEVEPVEPEEE